MSERTEAWVLKVAEPGESGRTRLSLEPFDLPEPGPDDVVADSLYGCFEGNMGHALERRPIDVCAARGEKRVALGNAGVVRVVRAPAGSGLEPGRLAMVFGGAVTDRFGYPRKIFAFDAPGTIGVLARRTVMPASCLIPIPEDSRFHPSQWAAFSVRYVTAWANWRLAFGVLRLELDAEELPRPHVWGWGGGTTLAQLELAARDGCAVVMISGDDRRLETIRHAGLEALDRRPFGPLGFDERRFSTDLAYRRAYLTAESAFLAEVAARTGGEGVHVFVDHIGGGVVRPTLRALARQGIITTAGWKDGQSIGLMRAMECIERHQHVHTHYARAREAADAVRYAEATGWMARLDEPIWPWERVDELSERFIAGECGMFPVFSAAD